MKKVCGLFCICFLLCAFFIVSCSEPYQESAPLQTEITDTENSTTVDNTEPENPVSHEPLTPTESDIPVESPIPTAPDEPVTPTAPTAPSNPATGEVPSDGSNDEVHTHKLDYIESKSATCTENGNIEYWHCAECNTDFADENAATEIENTEISAFGHEYTTAVIDATCTQSGYTNHKCDLCGDEYITDEVAANGHEYGDPTFVTQPTCTQSGKQKRICLECGDEEESELSALGHEYTTAVIDATCTKGGYTNHKCDLCGDEYVTDEVAANGHEYGDPTVVTQPTCIQSGKQKRICIECGDEEESELSALGHEYTTAVIDATCIQGGYTNHRCEICGDEYNTDIISATGHIYSEEWSYDGERHWHEVMCGCEIEAEKIGHEYNEDGVCECGKAEEWAYKLVFVSEGSEYTVSGITVNDGIDEGSLEVVIPSEYNGQAVTKIADNAFNGNRYMKSVYIPTAVIFIGKGAFSGSSVESAVFEVTTRWKYSKYADKRAAMTLTIGSAINAAKLLSIKSPSGYADYYWFR